MEIEFVSSGEDLIPDESEEEIFTESRPQSNRDNDNASVNPFDKKTKKTKTEVEVSPKSWKTRQNGR